MQREKKIEDLIAPVADGLGYEIVRVALIGNVNPTLQIMIDRKNLKPVVIKDCVKVSKAVSELLDKNIDYEYNLEVSSPGVGRPLTKPEHFVRFLGFEAKIETDEAVSGRKRFKGKLIKAGEQDVTIENEGAEYTVAFDNITKAKLVLDDRLLQACEQESEDEN